MKKKFLSLLVVICILAAFVPCVNAAEIVASGNCGAQGDNLTWTLDSEGTLTISGSGEMAAGRNPNSAALGYLNILWTKNGYYSHWQSYDKEHDEYFLAKRIKRVIIEKGVTSIGESSFYNCSNMESISIPDSVTEIANGAFENCYNLPAINIPQSVISIGSNAFINCANINNVILPEHITRIESNCFSLCDALTNITIPDSVTYIGYGAFGDSGLIRLPVSKYVTYLDPHACGSNWGDSTTPFMGFDVDESNPAYTSRDGVLFSKDMTKMLIYPIGKYDKKYSIPESVKEINEYVFSDNPYITSIELSGNIEAIYQNAIAPVWDMSKQEYKNIDLYYYGSEVQWNNIKAYYDRSGDWNGDKYEYTWTEGTIGDCTGNLFRGVTVHFMITPEFSIEKNMIRNTTNAPQYATVIIAAYDANGVLTDVNFETVTFNAGEEKSFQVPQNGKIFVWNSFGGMIPLTK